MYPFGYGLSYTAFAYGDLKLSSGDYKSSDTITVSFTVKNTGSLAGAEIAQVYVAKKDSAIFRAAKELKGFEKVFLQSGETKTVSVTLDDRSFAYYNVPKETWALEGGEYEILVGSSSRDIHLRASVHISGDGYEVLLQNQKNTCPEYFNLPKNGMAVSDASFEALYGQTLPPSRRGSTQPFDLNTTLGDVKDLEAGKKFIDALSLFALVAHVADVRSMVVHPASTTHSQLSAEDMKSTGITPEMVRLSVGIEDAGDLIADLKQALVASQR
jgi:beta-glucosidase